MPSRLLFDYQKVCDVVSDQKVCDVVSDQKVSDVVRKRQSVLNVFECPQDCYSAIRKYVT